AFHKFKEFSRCARFCGALEQDGAARHREPEQKRLLHRRAEQPRERRGDPQAQTVEAVEQPAPDAVAEAEPYVPNRAPWTVLGGPQGRHSPDAEDAESQPIKVRHVQSHASSTPLRFSREARSHRYAW